MKFLLDESADFRIRSTLLQYGHEVYSVARDYRFSTPDSDVLAIALRGQMIIITEDPDFGELLVRRQHNHAGVMLFRLKTTDIRVKQQRLIEVLEHHAGQLRSFIIVTERRIRIRER